MFAGVKGPINTKHLKVKGIVISATYKDIWHKTVGLKSQGHKDLMVTATIARSMDIEPLSANQSLCGHQISMQEETTMHTITTGTTTLGKVVTIVKNMDKYLRTALDNTLKETTTDGWTRPLVSVAWRLDMSARTVQQRLRHPRLKSTREKKKLMLKTSRKIWRRHDIREMDQVHPMEGSLHPRGQVITPHPTKY